MKGRGRVRDERETISWVSGEMRGRERDKREMLDWVRACGLEAWRVF